RAKAATCERVHQRGLSGVWHANQAYSGEFWGRVGRRRGRSSRVWLRVLSDCLGWDHCRRLLNSNPLGFPASKCESSASYENHEGISQRNRLNYSHLLTGRETEVQEPATLLIRPIQSHNSISFIVS